MPVKEMTLYKLHSEFAILELLSARVKSGIQLMQNPISKFHWRRSVGFALARKDVQVNREYSTSLSVYAIFGLHGKWCLWTDRHFTVNISLLAVKFWPLPSSVSVRERVLLNITLIRDVTPCSMTNVSFVGHFTSIFMAVSRTLLKRRAISATSGAYARDTASVLGNLLKWEDNPPSA